MVFSYIYSIGDGNKIKPYIEITGVSGGTAPYYYSLTGNLYQTATTFNNLSYGHYTIYVTDEYDNKTYEKVYIPKAPVVNVSTNGCGNIITLTLNIDDGCVKRNYTDENGYNWNIIDNCPCGITYECSVPGNVEIVFGDCDGNVEFGWDTVPGAIGYDVLFCSSGSCISATTTNLTYEFSGAGNSILYGFSVRANFTSNPCEWSTPIEYMKPEC